VVHGTSGRIPGSPRPIRNKTSALQVHRSRRCPKGMYPVLRTVPSIHAIGGFQCWLGLLLAWHLLGRQSSAPEPLRASALALELILWALDFCNGDHPWICRGILLPECIHNHNCHQKAPTFRTVCSIQVTFHCHLLA